MAAEEPSTTPTPAPATLPTTAPTPVPTARPITGLGCCWLVTPPEFLPEAQPAKSAAIAAPANRNEVFMAIISAARLQNPTAALLPCLIMVFSSSQTATPDAEL